MSDLKRIAEDLANHWLKYHNEQIREVDFQGRTINLTLMQKKQIKKMFNSLIN